MIIKISEKPVISIDTGKALGTLKGLIYKNNKVTFLYCKLSHKYVYIPVKDAFIGSDAIMLKVTEDITMLHMDTATKVYTEDGKEVGTVTSIETDDLFNITGIIVDDLFIKINKILHMENIIIVENDKKNIESASAHTSIDPIIHTDVTDKSDDQYEDEQANLINHDLSIDSNPDSIQQLVENPSESKEAIEEISESEIPTKSDEDELEIEIDPRYNNLCGKKLLEDITIVKETYNKGTLIDAALIQFAINNNAIVNVIMNTED